MEDWVVRLRKTLADTGWSGAELSRRSGVNYDNIRAFLSGRVEKPRGNQLVQISDALGVTERWLLYGTDNDVASSVFPLMGYVGAGAEIEPEFEQVPPDGLEQISVPYALSDDLIALQVRGESMLPRYDPDDVILVYREQRRPLESFYGEEAAVRTADGRRFLKTIMRSNGGISLFSWNAKPIENIHLEWIGEIHSTIRASQFRRDSRRKK